MLFWFISCVVSHHPSAVEPSPTPSASSWEQALAAPGLIEHVGVIGARWSVPMSGLINLDNPLAAGLVDGPVNIVLPLHLLKHPTRGLFIVDSGISDDLAAGGYGPAKGLIRAALKGMEPVNGLGAVLAAQGKPVAGALITHAHIDHVMGLQDLPESTPIFMGPGELSARRGQNVALRRSYKQIFKDQAPVHTWDFAAAPSMAPTGPAIDVLGDGSIWAISVPGHTPGSTAYLAMTTEGPMLFTGDCSHTIWGWEHGVEPGTYSDDTQANAVSLALLEALVKEHPEIKVWVGHELDGEGTGVD